MPRVTQPNSRAHVLTMPCCFWGAGLDYMPASEPTSWLQTSPSQSEVAGPWKPQSSLQVPVWLQTHGPTTVWESGYRPTVQTWQREPRGPPRPVWRQAGCGAGREHSVNAVNVASFQPHQAVTPASQMKKPRFRGRATFAQRSHSKELGFQAVSLSYLKGKKKISSSFCPTSSSHAQTPRPAQSFHAPHAPSPGHVCGPTWRQGSGRHGKGEEAKGGDREKARVGWGPRAPPAWARVCATQVRGPKAVAFHASAVPEQKAEPSLPRAGAGFQHTMGPGTNTAACLVWWGAGGARPCPIPSVPRVFD